MPVRLPDSYEPLLLMFYGEPRREGGWLIIGNDYGTELRADDDGQVLSIDSAGRLPVRFVNSSIEKFSRSIDLHRELRSQLESDSDEDAQRDAVGRFRRELQSLDAAALSDPDNWWAVVVEQMME
jgi:hypothetical protein